MDRLAIAVSTMAGGDSPRSWPSSKVLLDPSAVPSRTVTNASAILSLAGSAFVGPPWTGPSLPLGYPLSWLPEGVPLSYIHELYHRCHSTHWMPLMLPSLHPCQLSHIRSLASLISPWYQSVLFALPSYCWVLCSPLLLTQFTPGGGSGRWYAYPVQPCLARSTGLPEALQKIDQGILIAFSYSSSTSSSSLLILV